jgi:hypothetical protein
MDNTYEFVALVLFILFFVSIVSYMCIRLCSRLIYMCMDDVQQPLLEPGR